MSRKLRVLNIDDSEQDVALIRRHLSGAGFELLCERVETSAAMKAALEATPWDVILCDYSMPQFNALQALKLVREMKLDIPFIILSGAIGEEIAVEAMRAGAHDYLMKDNLLRLAPAIERELQEADNRRARRQAEVASRESEDRYRDLIEHSHELIYTHDLEGRILSFNQAAQRLMGYDQSSVLPHNIRQLLFPQYQHEFDDYLAELRQKGEARGVIAVQTRSGEKRLLEYYNTLRTEGVAVPLVRGMAHDVTEQKQSEKILRAREQRFRALIENSSDAVALFGADGTILYASPSTPQVTGFTPDEFVHFKVAELIHPDDRELATKRLILALKQPGVGISAEARVRHKDGSWRWMEGMITNLLDEPSVAAIVDNYRDITERKQAQEEMARLNAELESQRQRLDNIVANVPGVVWEARGAPGSATQRLTFVSDYAKTMLGYSIEEWLSTPNLWLSIIHPDDRERIARESAALFANGKSNVTLEFRWLAKDGRAIWVEGNSAIILDEQGQPVGVRGVTTDISERKRAEEALRESEERYKGLIDSAFDGVVIHQNNIIKSANRAYAEMFGYSVEELLDRNILELTPAEYRDFVFSEFSQDDSLYEAVGLKKDGTYINIEVSAKNCLYEGAEARLAAVRDITERKQAEEQLRHQLDFTKAITASLGEGVYALDQKGRLTFMNPAAERALGWTQAELLGKPMHEIIHFQYADGNPYPADQCPMLKVLHSGQASQIGSDVFTRKDGSMFPVAYTSSPIITDGQIIGVVLAFHDIIERQRVEELHLRREAQAALRADINGAFVESDSSLQQILARCTEAIVQHLGAAFARIWTLNPDENVLELQASAGIYTHIDGPHARVPVGAFKIGRIAEERQPHITNDVQSDPRVSDKEWAKREGIIAFAGYPLMVSDRLVGIVAMFARHKLAEDTIEALASIAYIISQGIERQRTEEALRLSSEQLLQAQKMEAIGQLAGGIAHDFNNLLTAINGYSQLTLMRLAAEDPLRDNLEEIKKAGDRAAALTRQLLIFSRKQVLQPKVLDLNLVVAEIEKMLCRLIGEDIELQTALAPDLGTVLGDPGQIEQVIMNLAVNARDAMQHGGKLTIETANVYLNKEYVTHHATVKPGYYAMLAVSDTGIGMDEQTQQHIFEPFFTTKESGKGTGLGLSTVYGIVKQAGGNIWVYSEVGRGTTFKVYLPRIDDEAQEYKLSTQAAEALTGLETILLAEDEEIVRKLVRDVLQSNGYQVLEAASGNEALLLCERHQGAIHLLLTDVVMPEMSGRELTEHLAQRRPEMKVLYMSGYTDDTIVRHGILESDIAFLQKPFTTDALARKVREVLD